MPVCSLSTAVRSVSTTCSLFSRRKRPTGRHDDRAYSCSEALMAASADDSAPAKRTHACALLLEAHGGFGYAAFRLSRSDGVEAHWIARCRAPAALYALPPEIFPGGAKSASE